MVRLKSRRDRRPSMPMESIWTFYPKFFGEVVGKTARWAALYLKLRKMYVAIKRDPKRYAYTDLAITPVTEDECRNPRDVPE